MKVWTAAPEGDFNQLKKEFAALSQADWPKCDGGIGRDSFHRGWNAYLGIAGLREYRVVPSDLTRNLRAEGFRIYNTIFG